MAEDRLKRETGLVDELYRSSSDISAVTIPFFMGPPDKISDVSVPAKGAAHFFHEPNNNFVGSSGINPTGMVINRTGTKMGKSHSLKRVVSLECLQKRMHGGPSPCDPYQ